MDNKQEKLKLGETGVYSSMGKEGELFGVNLKNLTDLEKGLALKGLGKQSAHLFLEQIRYMTVYPRHAEPKSSEGLGEIVEVMNLKNLTDPEKGLAPKGLGK